MKTALSVLLALAVAAQASAQPVVAQAPADTESVVSRGPLFQEPRVLAKAITFATPYLGGGRHERGTGFYPNFGDMVTGSGWVAAGPGARYWFGTKAYIDGSAAVSWHAYKEAQVTFEVPRLARGHLTVGSQAAWNDMTQVHYFGLGADAPDVTSEYRLKTLDLVGYARLTPRKWLAVDGRLGWLAKPTLTSPSGWFDADYPDTQTVFTTDPGVGVQPASYAHGEVAVTADNRDFPSYPTRGSVLRASWSSFGDRVHDAYSFQRYEVEGASFLPVVRDRWVLAVHGWGVFTDIAPGHTVPFFMLPTLGGGNTLRGDRNYRYHDRDLLLVNAESRVGLFEHMDVAVFMDAGNVGPDAGALNLDKRAYGAGVRFHTRSSTLARFDLAHGKEQGWCFMLKLHDPLRMGRISKHTVPVPFVP